MPLSGGMGGRFAAAGYARSQIAFAPDTFTKKFYLDLAAAAKALSSPNIRAVPDLVRNRRGRTVDIDAAFYKRYPEAFHYSAWFDDPGDTPRSLALMEKVSQAEAAIRRNLPSWLRSD